MQVKLNHGHRTGRDIDPISISPEIDPQQVTENNSDRCLVRHHQNVPRRIPLLNLRDHQGCSTRNLNRSLTSRLAVNLLGAVLSSRVTLNRLFQFNLDWFRVPDFLAVLPNRTIGGKFAHSGRI